MTAGSPYRANELLGYPKDARLLILNADDFGMCHAVNTGIASALDNGIIQSTTLMTPCPWALHAMAFLRDKPHISFGIHLTFISETVNYKWGSLTSREKVPSLMSDNGYFYNWYQMSDYIKVAKLDEVEIESRAQIERVLSEGLQPTHFDWHCLYNGGRDDIFYMTAGLAKEYGLALRVGGQAYARSLQEQGLPCNDYDVLDSFRLDSQGKSEQYIQLLQDLPEGLTEWAIHPAIENDELLAIEPTGNHVRQTDYEFWTSEEARQAIEREGIILLDYKPLQALWKQATP